MAIAASGYGSQYQINEKNYTPYSSDISSGGISYGPQQNYTPAYANVNYGTKQSYIPSNKQHTQITSPTSGSIGITPAPAPTPAPTGPSQEDLMREIDGVYSESYNYLNNVEGQLNRDYPNVLAEAESMFNTNKSMLEGNRVKANNQLNQNVTKATDTRDNALAEARRLYQELQMGYGQRFGGSSSAGQAASEIASVEQQRQQGGVNRDFRNVQQQIEQQRTELESNFQTQLLQLEQSKQQAINQAQRDFQNKLLEINKMRAELGQNKAAMRLQALQELRAQAMQIEAENRQFQQQLQLQRQAAQTSLSAYAQQSLQGLGLAQGATDAYNPYVQSNLQTSNNQYSQNPQMVGQISRKPEEEFARQYAPLAYAAGF